MTHGYRLDPIAGMADLAFVTPPVFSDGRGWLSESYSRAAFAEMGLPDFVQDNRSFTLLAGTVRGLHFQTPPHGQAKLFRVIRGEVLNMALDLREPGFGAVVTTALEQDGLWIFIPEGAAHGFQALSDGVEITYKCSRPFSGDAWGQVNWEDPAIKLPLAMPVPAEARSARDALSRPLAEWRGLPWGLP